MQVGIIGGGIWGLTLALRAQQLGLQPTSFSDRSPEDLRRSRVENLVARVAAFINAARQPVEV